MVLAIAGRPVPIEETLRLLREAWPGLEAPLVIASAGDAGRRLAEALAAGRENLLGTVLEFLPATTAQSGEKVPVDVLLPYVHDPAERVRVAALSLLERDAGFVAGPEIEALLGDPSLEVRKAAAALLAVRGRGGQARLVEHFRTRSDPEVEAWAAGLLGHGPAAKALARQRLSDPACPVSLALAQALQLVRAGEPLDPSAQLGRWLAAGDEDAAMLAYVASEAGWVEHRDRLQARWRAAQGAGRQRMGASLARWDFASQDAKRVVGLFEILSDGRNPALRDVLTSLQGNTDRRVRERADEVARRWAEGK
jgi:hypothetical protein